MLARWFDRSGIGQKLAPDSKAKTVSEDDESRSNFWALVAPDPKFTPSDQQPSAPITAPLSSSTSGTVMKADRKLLCMHCNKWTNMNTIAASTLDTTKELLELDGLMTPVRKIPSPLKNTPNDLMADVNDRVLSACRDTSKYMRSPKLERNANDKFLRICGSTTQMNQKLETKYRKLLKKKPYLHRVRATKLGETAPDGYTSLQVTAYANHVKAAKIILESEEEYRKSTGDNTYSDLHLDRDMLGHTALHIAGERGNLEMIQLLLPYYKFPESLVDLDRQTAFGRAVTSPNPKARRNQRTMEKTLFSRNDLSIFGDPKTNEERMGKFERLKLEYGTSEMPGRRGYMEDAMCVETWCEKGEVGSNADAKSQQFALLAVCDGHGDNGVVSKFIASNVSSVVRECISKIENSSEADITRTDYWSGIWHAACLQLDLKLKQEEMITGGSTAVIALITEHEIVVANVGDSRCILIREKDGEDTSADDVANDIDLEDTDDIKDESNGETADATPVNAATVNETSEPPALLDESAISTTDKQASRDGLRKSTVVTALSEDHKPSLPNERARIVNAGFQVKGVTFEEDGEMKTIHKVVMNENNQLAVSRSFGDFDYKANDQLQASDQSVISIAEVRVHQRDPSKDLFLFLACDGIWDVMKNHEVMDFVQQQIEIKAETSFNTILPDVADVLLQECLRRESRDNMSCILINLQPRPNTTTMSSHSSMAPKALHF